MASPLGSPLSDLFPELPEMPASDSTPGEPCFPREKDVRGECMRCGVLRGDPVKAAFDVTDFDNPGVKCQLCLLSTATKRWDEIKCAPQRIEEDAYVYFLVSEVDPTKYYVGITYVPETRLQEHNWYQLTEFERQMVLATREHFYKLHGFNVMYDKADTKSTMHHGPYRMVYKQRFPNRLHAIQKERFYHTLTQGDPRAGGSSLAASLIRAELRLRHPDLWDKLRVSAGNGEMVALHQQLRFVG